MDEKTTTHPPAGWYPDPAGSGRQRYWDGARWTEQLDPPDEPLAETAPVSQQDARANPPRWHQNPDGPGLRYWDGESWTDNYHPGDMWTSNATVRDLLWGLSLGFGVSGGGAAAFGVPVLAYYFPLGLGAAGLALAIAAATVQGPHALVRGDRGDRGDCGAGDRYRRLQRVQRRLRGSEEPRELMWSRRNIVM